jgi:hypothetical protein
MRGMVMIMKENIRKLFLIIWFLEIVLLSIVGPQFLNLLLFVTLLSVLGILVVKSDRPLLIQPRKRSKIL